MNYKQLANKIPIEYRNNILINDRINKARPNAANEDANYLFTIWQIYVDREATLDINCGSCVQNILNNFKQLQPVLIELKKQETLLKNLN